MSFPVYLRGFSLLSLRLKIFVLIVVELQSAFLATATAGVTNDAGSEATCAPSQSLQTSPIEGQSPCKGLPSDLAKQAALMQKGARLAPSNIQGEGEDIPPADGGGLSKVQQSIARRDRALLRAQQARRAAQIAKERRMKLEDARAHRLKTHVQTDGMLSQPMEDTRHLRKKIWNNIKEARNVNPMVTMVFLLMSVPAGVVVASLSALLYIKWGERNEEKKLGRRPARQIPLRRGK